MSIASTLVQAAEVQVGGFWAALVPYLAAAAGAIITTCAGWITYIMRTKFNIEIDNSLSQRLQQSALNAATAAIAQVEGPINNIKIDVDSPLVAYGVNYLNTHAKETVGHFKMTPVQVAELVQAKLGYAQTLSGTGTNVTVASPTVARLEGSAL